MADLPTIVFYVSSETYNNDLLEATYTIKARGKAEDSTQAHKWSLAGTLYGSGLYRYTQNSVYYTMGSGYFKIFEFNSPIYSATLNTSSYTDFDWSTTVTVHFNAATGLPILGMGGVHVVWDKSTSNGGFISNTNQHVSTVKPSGYTLGDDYGYIGLQWYYKVEYDANDATDNYISWNSALYNENNVLVQSDGAHWTYNPHTRFAEMPATGTAPSYETMLRCVISGVRENGLCIGVHSIPVNNKYSIYVPGEINEIDSRLNAQKPGSFDELIYWKNFEEYSTSESLFNFDNKVQNNVSMPAIATTTSMLYRSAAPISINTNTSVAERYMGIGNSLQLTRTGNLSTTGGAGESSAQFAIGIIDEYAMNRSDGCYILCALVKPNFTTSFSDWNVFGTASNPLVSAHSTWSSDYYILNQGSAGTATSGGFNEVNEWVVYSMVYEKSSSQLTALGGYCFPAVDNFLIDIIRDAGTLPWRGVIAAPSSYYTTISSSNLPYFGIYLNNLPQDNLFILSDIKVFYTDSSFSNRLAEDYAMGYIVDIQERNYEKYLSTEGDFIDFNKMLGNLEAVSFTENSAVDSFIMNKDGSIIANQFIEY